MNIFVLTKDQKLMQIFFAVFGEKVLQIDLLDFPLVESDTEFCIFIDDHHYHNINGLMGQIKKGVKKLVLISDEAESDVIFDQIILVSNLKYELENFVF